MFESNNQEGHTFFPILIAVQKAVGEYVQMVVEKPEGIPAGAPYRVLGTNVEGSMFYATRAN